MNNPDGTARLNGDIPGLRYSIYQLEQGDAGTPHWQGYLEFSTPKRLSAVRQVPGLERAHFEPRRGTREQARDYCRKQESRLSEPVEFGDFGGGGQGTRNDLSDVKRILDTADESNTSKLQRVADANFGTFIRYHKGMDRYLGLKEINRVEKTKVTVYFGKPGTGKSYRARRLDFDSCYWKQQSAWWDNYEGQRCTVLDEFNGWLKWGDFLQLMDENPLMIEKKGGQTSFISEQLAITTNAWPMDWYKPEGHPWTAIARRVDRWIYCFDQQTEIVCTNWDDFTAEYNRDTYLDTINPNP